MKKIAVFLLSLLLVSSLYGRDRKDEFALTYSQFTVPEFAYIFGGVLGVAFTAGHFSFGVFTATLAEAAKAAALKALEKVF